MSGITLGGPSRHQPNTAPSKNANTEPKQFNRSKGKKKTGEFVVIYGPSGSGKTSLAAMAPNSVMLDIENGSYHLDTERIETETGEWAYLDLIECLSNLENFKDFVTINIDSWSKVEKLIVQYVVEKFPDIESFEDEKLNYEKGWKLAYEEAVKFIALIERICRTGKYVNLIAHDKTERFENPEGGNFVRYEPSIHHNPRYDSQSIRNLIKNQCGDILFIKYDLIADKGKARGAGTRTICTQERPSYMAKSRLLKQNQYVYTKNQDPIWAEIHGEQL